MRLEKRVNPCFRNTDVPSIYFLFLVCEKLCFLVYLKIWRKSNFCALAHGLRHFSGKERFPYVLFNSAEKGVGGATTVCFQEEIKVNTVQILDFSCSFSFIVLVLYIIKREIVIASFGIMQ